MVPINIPRSRTYKAIEEIIYNNFRRTVTFRERKNEKECN